MARTLGGVALPYQLEWADKDAWQLVAQQVDFTLAGTPVVHARAWPKGRPIILEARDGVCWVDAAQLAALQALAAGVGTIHAFVWDSYSANVVFAHHNPPAMEFEPLFPHGTDYFIGTMRLITV